jgi:hypothetical protein
MVLRRLSSHILHKTGSQMALRMSVLYVDHAPPPGRFLVLISVRERLSKLLGHNAARKIRSNEGSNNFIRNGSRNLRLVAGFPSRRW